MAAAFGAADRGFESLRARFMPKLKEPVRVRILEKWKPLIAVPMNLPFREKGKLRIEKLGRGKRKRYVKKWSRTVLAETHPLTPEVEAQKEVIIRRAKAKAKEENAPFFNDPKARATQQTKFKNIVFVPTTPTTYFDWVGSRDSQAFKKDVKTIRAPELMKHYPYVLAIGALIAVGPKGKTPTHLLLVKRSEKVEICAGYGHVPAGLIDLKKAPVHVNGKKIDEYQIPEIPSKAALREVAEELFIRPLNHKVELPRKLSKAKQFEMHFLDKSLEHVPALHSLSTPEMPIRMEPPAVVYGVEVDNITPFAMYAMRVHATKEQIEKAMKKAPDKWEMQKPIWIRCNSKALLKELDTRTYVWDKPLRLFAKALAAKEKK